MDEGGGRGLTDHLGSASEAPVLRAHLGGRVLENIAPGHVLRHQKLHQGRQSHGVGAFLRGERQGAACAGQRANLQGSAENVAHVRALAGVSAHAAFRLRIGVHEVRVIGRVVEVGARRPSDLANQHLRAGAMVVLVRRHDLGMLGGNPLVRGRPGKWNARVTAGGRGQRQRQRQCQRERRGTGRNRRRVSRRGYGGGRARSVISGPVKHRHLV